MKVFVATYGTLRVGESYWRTELRHDSKHLGTFRVSGFEMYALKGPNTYPYAVVGDGEITVDLFETSEEMLRILDRIEGYPRHYDRQQVSIGGQQAWIYHYSKPDYIRETYPRVESGDWKNRA